MGETARHGEERALLCRIDHRLCALPLAVVSETMRPLPIEPMPGAPQGVLGLAVIRGVPTPVIDGGALFGASVAATRFITLRVGSRSVALAVDAVVGIRSLPNTHELPPLTRDAAAHAIASIGTLDRELVLVLEAMRLMPAEIA